MSAAQPVVPAAPPADVQAILAKMIADAGERDAPIIRDAAGAKVVDLASYKATKAVAKNGGQTWDYEGKPFTKSGMRLPPPIQQPEYDANDPLKGAGMRAAQFIKAHLMAGMLAKGGQGDLKTVVKMWEAEGKLDPYVAKALLESTILDGGIFVPPEFSSELIPLLRPQTVLLASGIRTVQMAGDQLVYGRQNAPATAFYVGEAFVTTYSQAQTSQLILKVKKLKAVTAITDELLRDGGPAADEFIRDDLVRVLALRMDLAGLVGDGTQETPLGLRNATASGNIDAATQAGSTATFQEISADVAKKLNNLEGADIPPGGWCWLMSPRSKNYLLTVSSSLGVYPFRDEMLTKGTFFGHPFFVTTAIVNNLGGGSNESTVFLNAAPQYLLGMREGLIVQAFPGGTFNDASGSLVSGISTGQTPITAEMRHDFAMRYTKGCGILTTVKWGV